MADSRGAESTIGGEVVVEPKPRGLSTADKVTLGAAKGALKTAEVTGKAAIGASKLALKGTVGTAKLTKNILSRPTRLVGRNAWGSKAGFGIAAGAVALGLAAGEATSSENKSAELLNDAPKAMRKAASGASDALLSAVNAVVSRAEEKSGNLLNLKIETLDRDEKLSSDEFFDLAFGKLSGSDKAVAYNKLLVANGEINKYHDDDVVRRSHKYEAMVRWFASEHNIRFEALMGLVIAESKGDPNAVSEDDAVGLTQLTPAVAEKWGLSLEDRRNPFLNLRAGASEIEDNMKKEGTLAGGLISHYMGLKGYTDFKRQFIASHYGIELGDIVAESTAVADENLRLNRLHTIQKDISPPQVFNDPAIAQEISGGNWKQPDMYIPYVVAAYLNFDRRKGTLGLDDVLPTNEGEEQFADFNTIKESWD